MFGVIDPLRLADSPVIHPHNNVLLAAAGRADRQRLTLFIQYHQGAGGIKTEAFDLNRVDTCLCHRIFYREAHTAPDIIGGLFHIIRLWFELTDIPLCFAFFASGSIKNPGPGAAAPDIHTNKIDTHNPLPYDRAFCNAINKIRIPPHSAMMR